jgi:hypothetical protein
MDLHSLGHLLGLHSEKHIAVDVIDNDIFILMFGVRNQNSASDERAEWDKYRARPRESLDTSEFERAIHSARSTYSSSIGLNERKLHGSNVRDTTSE